MYRIHWDHPNLNATSVGNFFLLCATAKHKEGKKIPFKVSNIHAEFLPNISHI